MRAWLLALLIALLACRRHSFEDEALVRAKQDHSVTALRDFADLYPARRDDVKPPLAALRAEALAAVRRNAAALEPGVLPFAEALLGWLDAHDTEKIRLVVEAPTTGGLEAADRELASAMPDALLAPVAPFFAGPHGWSHGFERVLRDRLAKIFPGAVVVFDVDAPPDGPTCAIAWSVAPGEAVFRVPATKRSYVSIVATFDLTMTVPGVATPLAVHRMAAPPANFEFETEPMRIMLDSTYPKSGGAGSSDDDVYAGIVQQDVGVLGDELVRVFTGVAPVRPAPPRETLAGRLCDQGDDDACMELADLLAAPDRDAAAHKTAADRYGDQCTLKHRAAACIKSARLSLATRDAQAAMDLLLFACSEPHQDADACLLLGDLAARAPSVAASMPAGHLILEGAEHAERHYGDACRLGSQEACKKLAAMKKK